MLEVGKASHTQVGRCLLLKHTSWTPPSLTPGTLQLSVHRHTLTVLSGYMDGLSSGRQHVPRLTGFTCFVLLAGVSPRLADHVLLELLKLYP